MTYVIDFDKEIEKYKMDGESYDFVGDILLIIARKENIEEAAKACSESHSLHILKSYGVDIELNFEF